MVVADRRAKLESRAHRSFPRANIRRARLNLIVTRAAEREVRAAALLVCMTEMA
jgi:hypothetical protein